MGEMLETGQSVEETKTTMDKGLLQQFSLEDLVHTKLEAFIEETDGYDVDGLYPIVIERIERPLIKLVLKKTRGNQVKAAEILGINRNTLRKKIHNLKIKVKK